MGKLGKPAMDFEAREAVVPCLQDMKELMEECKKMGLAFVTLPSTPARCNGSVITKSKKMRLSADDAPKLNWGRRKYEVEDILDVAVHDNKKLFLIKWKGWHLDSSSWEPRENLIGCEQILRRFYKLTQKKKKDKKMQCASMSHIFATNEPAYSPVEFETLRMDAFRRLKEWENDLNRLCSDTAAIYVVNDVDLEGPPENFTYVNDYKAGEGIEIPDDPLVGCECTDCFQDRMKCCGHQSGGQFAYNRKSRVNVPCGSPIYECNKRCACGPDCPNRVVQKGRKVKVAIFRTRNGCGWGVMAMEPISKHQFVMEYVGEVITSDEAERRGADYDQAGRTYLFDLDYNDDDCPFTVDAAYYGNISHFVNHSCDPNLVQYGVWINSLDPRIPKIAFFAARNILKGEQLTFDYKMNTKYEGEESTQSKRNRILCKCGTENCRKYMF